MKEFFAMGGYGLYVWGSFGVTFVLMTAEPLLVIHRRRTIWRRLARIVRLKSEETT